MGNRDIVLMARDRNKRRQSVEPIPSICAGQLKRNRLRDNNSSGFGEAYHAIFLADIRSRFDIARPCRFPPMRKRRTRRRIQMRNKIARRLRRWSRLFRQRVTATAPLQIPIEGLAEGEARIAAGLRQFSLCWKGGDPPCVISLNRAGAPSLVAMNGIQSPEANGGAVDLEPGTYDVRVGDRRGAQTEGTFTTVPSSEIPAVGPAGTGEKATLAQANALLAQGRAFDYEAYLRLRGMKETDLNPHSKLWRSCPTASLMTLRWVSKFRGYRTARTQLILLFRRDHPLWRPVGRTPHFSVHSESCSKLAARARSFYNRAIRLTCSPTVGRVNSPAPSRYRCGVRAVGECVRRCRRL
jgi:hypothetical protein